MLKVDAQPHLKFSILPMVGLVIAGTTALAVLITSLAAPGCTGPASRTPCDYLQIAKQALAGERGFSPYFPIVVLDEGSSVYLQQTTPPGSGFILHTPGVLIDRKSCRVCQVDGYDTNGSDPDQPVLATYGPERPLHPKVGWMGY